MADGDSLTSGFGEISPYTSEMTLNLVWQKFNVAIAGETLANMLANAPTVVDPKFKTGFKNVVVIWGGDNDFTINGQTASQVYTTMTSYVAARHAVGWQVVVATTLSRSPSTFDAAFKVPYNTLILANTAGADGVVDFSGTPLGCNGCYTNLTYYQSDQIHPNQTSITNIEAPFISAGVNALP